MHDGGAAINSFRPITSATLLSIACGLVTLVAVINLVLLAHPGVAPCAYAVTLACGSSLLMLLVFIAYMIPYYWYGAKARQKDACLVRAHTHTHTLTLRCTHTHTHTHTYTQVHAHTHTHTHTHTLPLRCVHTHARSHTRARAHPSTQVPSFLLVGMLTIMATIMMAALRMCGLTIIAIAIVAPLVPSILLLLVSMLVYSSDCKDNCKDKSGTRIICVISQWTLFISILLFMILFILNLDGSSACFNWWFVSAPLIFIVIGISGFLHGLVNETDIGEDGNE